MPVYFGANCVPSVGERVIKIRISEYLTIARIVISLVGEADTKNIFNNRKVYYCPNLIA